MSTNFYVTLGVKSSASSEELKKAYRSRLRAAHPDTGGSHDQFVQVQEAWETLGNAASRSSYDQANLLAATPTIDFSSYATSTSRNYDDSDLEDIDFEDPQTRKPPSNGFRASSTAPTSQEHPRTLKDDQADLASLAARLYEETLRRQAAAIKVEEEWRILSAVNFPLKGSVWGVRLVSKYLDAYTWGVALSKIHQWKLRDIRMIRGYLGLIIVQNILTLIFNGLELGNPAHTAGFASVFSWLIGTVFADLGFLIMGFLAIVGIWVYRWVRYSIMVD